MKVDLPGFIIDRNRNGTKRHRVRVAGDKNKRITIPVGPADEHFLDYYHAARAGEIWEPPQDTAEENSLDWLVGKFIDYMEVLQESGQLAASTVTQRKSVLRRLCDHLDGDGDRYGISEADVPSSAIAVVRDAWADRPGAADNLVKSVKALYDWGLERPFGLTSNPALGIRKINKKPKGGATPWTLDDLKAFRKRHPKGTTAHLWLTLQAFTACRIGDAIWLGRDQEEMRDGQLFLEWQPRKKGSAFVSIPMLPPLVEATRAAKVIGPSYILSDKGQPFASTESLRRRVQKWCDQAGLEKRSSHGVRKAVGELMAESGCSQHQIMAVMAHTEAKTSEVYTKGAERRVLATVGIQALGGLDW